MKVQKVDVTYVYVIAAMDGGGGYRAPSKVGITKELGSRLSTIQTSCPFRIGLAHQLVLPERRWAQHIEWCYHGLAEKKRSHGEWFNVDPPAVERMLALIFEGSLLDKGFGVDETRRILLTCGVKAENFTFIDPQDSSA